MRDSEHEVGFLGKCGGHLEAGRGERENIVKISLKKFSKKEHKHINKM